MYEHKRQPLASRQQFIGRIGRNLFLSLLILCFSLLIGTVGFRAYASEAYSWVDCFHNASMLLSGMGPVITDFESDAGKIFSSLYALYSGITLLTSVSVLLAPVVHRFFHKLHLDEAG
ncbi:MAG: hypothetical protein MUF62_13135 [Chitinophagaceae bacterium]|nr:hypothetical protein [Chitinophagaceae bacterium]